MGVCPYTFDKCNQYDCSKCRIYLEMDVQNDVDFDDCQSLEDSNE